MATTTSITTTYAGEFKNQIIAAALLSAPTIDAGGITVKPGIKYKEVMKKLSTDAILKNATCDFDATSTITLTERILQPEEFQVNLQLCKKDYHSDWLSAEQGYSAFDVIPKTFADFLVAHVAAKVAAKNETNIWSGVTANAGEFDGFATLLAADAALPAAQEVAGTTVTSANVVAEMEKGYALIPTPILYSAKLVYYVSAAVYRAYTSALGTNSTNWQYDITKGISKPSYKGIVVEMIEGITLPNRYVIAEKSNLHFATDLVSDFNSFQMQGGDVNVLLGDNIAVKGGFSVDSNYAVSQEVVIYA